MVPRPVRGFVLFAAALLGVAQPGVAADMHQPPVPEARPAPDDGLAWLAAKVAALDSDELLVRDAADEAIRVDDRTNLALIERFLAGPGATSLSLEQRERIVKLALELFRHEPRGALGVSFARFDASEGVEISGTVDGFDAARSLRRGDIMRAMDGVPVRFNNEARAVILSHDPGDELNIEIVRQGEVRSVTVRLGSFHQLRNAYEPEDMVLAAAWELRCARRSGQAAAELPRVLDPGLSGERWLDLTRNERARERLTMRQTRRGFEIARAEEPPPRLIAGGLARGVPEGADGDFLPRTGLIQNQEMEGLMGQIADLSARIRSSEVRVRDARLTEQQRRMLKSQLDVERQTRDDLRKKLDMIREREAQKRR